MTKLLRSLGPSLAGLIALSATAASAAPADPTPVVATQPDGITFLRVLTGDEREHHWETPGGWTIVEDLDGTWVFAIPDESGRLAPSPVAVGAGDPTGLGVPKHLEGRRVDIPPLDSPPRFLLDRETTPAPPLPAGATTFAISPTGTAKHLVVLAAFSDHWDDANGTALASAGHPRERYEALFNELGYTWDGAAGSVRDYFREASTGALDVQSVVSVWVRLPGTEASYGDVGDGADNGKKLVTDALAALDAAGFDFAPLDSDHDGWVDMLTVLHSGYDAAQGAPDTAIWSHASSIPAVTRDGVKLSRYTTSAALRGTPDTGPAITRIGTICHELGHFLGIRDLYDRDGAEGGDGRGLGTWSLMSSGNYRGGGARPAPFDAFSRVELGWVTPLDVHALPAGSGYVWTLPKSGSAGVGTVLRVTDGLPEGEALYLEYFGNSGKFYQFPLAEGLREGLAIWHVDQRNAGNDSPDDPHAQRIRLHEADANGSLSRSYAAGGSVQQAGDLWVEGTFEAPRDDGGPTDRDGQATGIRITDIAGAGTEQMSFNLESRVPYLSVAGKRRVGHGQPVALRWGRAAGATGYRVYRGTDDLVTSYIDDAESGERFAADWSVAGPWIRFDHDAASWVGVGSAASQAHSYWTAMYVRDQELDPAAPDDAWSYRGSYFRMTFTRPVHIGANAEIRWRDKYVYAEGDTGWHRLQVRRWESQSWKTLATINGEWTWWWTDETVEGAALAPYVGEWVQLRFDCAIGANALIGGWPHQGFAFDDFGLTGVSIPERAWTLVGEVGAEATTYAAPGLDADGSYHYVVRAVFTGGAVGGASNAVRTEVAFDADGSPPATITDLHATPPDGAGSATLSWTAPGDDGTLGVATRYEVRRTTAGALTEASWDDATLVAGAPLPAPPGQHETMTVGGMVANTTYRYAVRAFDDEDNAGALSNVVTVAVAGAAPTPPRGPSPADGVFEVPVSSGLTWTNGDGTAQPVDATEWSVQLYVSPNLEEVEFLEGEGWVFWSDDPAAASWAPDDGWEQGTRYFWRVVNANGNGLAEGPIWSFTTYSPDTTPPAEITDLAAAVTDGGDVLLTWTAPGDDGDDGRALLYDVRVSAAPLTAATFDAATQLSSAPSPGEAGEPEAMVASGLEAGVPWHFALRAVDEANNAGPVSAEVVATIPDGDAGPGELAATHPPVAPTAPDPSQEAETPAAGVTLRWALDVGGAFDAATTDVVVLLSQDAVAVANVAEGAVAFDGAAVEALDVGALEPGAWFWRVAARNGSGASLGPVWRFTAVADGAGGDVGGEDGGGSGDAWTADTADTVDPADAASTADSTEADAAPAGGAGGKNGGCAAGGLDPGALLAALALLLLRLGGALRRRYPR